MGGLARWVGEHHTPVERYEKPQENADNENSKEVLQALEVYTSKLHFAREGRNGHRAAGWVGE